MAEYNGYPSWNAWNVSLWINNDENMYYWCRELTRELGRKRAARQIVEAMKGEKTPEGATYNFRSVYGALEEIV